MGPVMLVRSGARVGGYGRTVTTCHGQCLIPSVDFESIEIGPVVAPCIVLFERKMLCAWSMTIDPPRLAVPRFTNGKRERLVLVNWLLTTTTSLARVMNRPGPRRLVKVLA